MRAVFGLVLLVGLGLAGFAVYMAKDYLDVHNAELARERAAVAAAVPTVELFAVTREIGYGEPLTREDVVAIRYAEPYLPEGVFLTEEELFPEGDEELRVVVRTMFPNEPVLANKVTEPGQDAGLTSRLDPGMRAFAISVDVSSGVSGFLRPGDRVDVYWTGSVQVFGDRQEITRLIESAIELVAIDQTADNNSNQATIARTVTVQVSPQQVANLAQAQSTGNLSLSLVGSGDDEVAEVIEVDQASLLGIQIQEPEVIEAAPVVEEEICTIRTRRGAEVVDIVIPCTE